MVRSQGLLKVTVSLVVVAVLAGVSHAQQRRGGGFGMRNSLLGLLRMEQVQDELKLTDEQKEKFQAISEKLMGEMREQFMALRDNPDRGNMRATFVEMSNQLDQKARGELRDVLDRDQMRRLNQIRLQVRPVLESLAIEFLAARLEITDQQQEKLAKIKDDTEAQRADLMSSIRDADQEQRQEMMRKLQALSSDTNDKALEVLTPEQKKAFEEMKGKIIELPARGGRGR